jgi:thermitase
MKRIILVLLVLVSFSSFAGSKYSGWGLESINLGRQIASQDEVTVAVIDTGIDSTHEYLSKNVIASYDFSKTGNRDNDGHGTHVAGIIKSIFPNVKLISLKYHNPGISKKKALEASLVALKKAVELNVDIINYSGGGPEASVEELRILKEAEKRGILVVCAAGNSSSDIDRKESAYYPAAYGLSNIIAVSAHDKNLKLPEFSNFGKKLVDIAAPGQDIKSSFPLNQSRIYSGTSMAAPFVTGIAAILKSDFKMLKAKDLKEIIKLSARKEYALRNFVSTGGILDATNALEVAWKRELIGAIRDSVFGRNFLVLGETLS